MSSFPWELVVYPLPILCFALGLRSNKPAFILGGAIAWYLMGWQGTVIGIASLVGWTILFHLARAVFTPRGW